MKIQLSGQQLNSLAHKQLFSINNVPIEYQKIWIKYCVLKRIFFVYLYHTYFLLLI